MSTIISTNSSPATELTSVNADQNPACSADGYLVADASPSSMQKNAVSTTKEKFMAATLVGSLGLALATTVLGPNVFAADTSLSVMEKVDLAVPPAKAWAVIKDFDGWQNWHPAIGSTDILKGKGNTKGTVRVLNVKDGAKFTEELLSHDEQSKTYQYKITKSPLPITNYISTLKVMPSKTGSMVVWSSNFMTNQGAADDEVKKAIAGIYTAGLDSLKSNLK